MQDRCIGIVQDRGTTTILLRGLYEFPGDAVILYFNFPWDEPPGCPSGDRESGIQAGDNPVCRRLVLRKEGTYAGGPEILIILIPY